MKIFVALAGIAPLAVLAVSAAIGAGSLGSENDTVQSPASGLAQSRRARILPIRSAPLTLRGTGFIAGEKVRVVVLGGPTKLARSVKVGSRGGFLVRFTTMVDPCRGLTVRAVGDRGSRASFQYSRLVCAYP